MFSIGIGLVGFMLGYSAISNGDIPAVVAGIAGIALLFIDKIRSQ